MRKILLSLSVLAGLGAVSVLPAAAAPMRHETPVASTSVQQVTYWHRHEMREHAWRRHEAMRHAEHHYDTRFAYHR